MLRNALRAALAGALAFTGGLAGAADRPADRRTAVSIRGDAFLVNGRPTYEGREWKGHRVEGLLLNSRMVQGAFDDRNPATVARWAYSDTGRWDPERNVREFVAAMPEWRRHGVLSFTINVQGGSPTGYSKEQPWRNTGYDADGTPWPETLARLGRILDRADELGMVPILGLFYFGQDEHLKDEAAVVHAVDAMAAWLLDRGQANVLVEIDNECNILYDHAILRPDRVHELILRVQKPTRGGRRLLAGTSYGGGTIPGENVVRASDFLLLHGNGVGDPARIAQMVRETRRVAGYTPKPILFNEDDHYDFEKPVNNFTAAVGEYASWGFFDYRREGEGFGDGFQSVPVDWRISSARKRGFFGLAAEIAGAR